MLARLRGNEDENCRDDEVLGRIGDYGKYLVVDWMLSAFSHFESKVARRAG